MSYGQGNFGSFEPVTYSNVRIQFWTVLIDFIQNGEDKFKKYIEDIAKNTARLHKETKQLSNLIQTNAPGPDM